MRTAPRQPVYRAQHKAAKLDPTGLRDSGGTLLVAGHSPKLVLIHQRGSWTPAQNRRGVTEFVEMFYNDPRH